MIIYNIVKHINLGLYIIRIISDSIYRRINVQYVQVLHQHLSLYQVFRFARNSVSVIPFVNLFSFCTSFYYCYLWTGYKKSTFNRLRVAFTNSYQRILHLSWLCSASGMYATYGIYYLEAIRKQTFGLTDRLHKSCNTIVQTLENAWII